MGRRVGRPKGIRVDGGTLRRIREDRGLTREQLAELASLTDKTIAAAERGRPLSKRTVRAVADALSLAPRALVSEPPARVTERLQGVGRSPPPPPDPWVPRPETADALAAVRAGSLCLAGPTGIGKTALARHIAAELADAFPGGVAWVGFDRVDLSVARRAQVDLACCFGFASGLPDEEVGAASFDRAFAARLWEKDRLVILDDVRDERLIEMFAPRGAGGFLIVTTFVRPVTAGFRGSVIEVGPLPDAQACTLLAQQGGGRVSADPEGTHELRSLLGGRPRALQLAGQLLAHRETLGPRALVDLLRADPLQLRHGEALAGDADERRNCASAASYRQLKPLVAREAWQLLCRCAAFGTTPFPARWAAACTTESGAVAEHLEALASLYLLERYGGDREWIYTLDDHALWYLNAEEPATVEQGRQRILRFAEQEADRLAGQPANEAARRFVHDRRLWERVLDDLSADAARELPRHRWPEPHEIRLVNAALPDSRALIHIVRRLGARADGPVLDRRWVTAGVVSAGTTREPGHEAQIAAGAAKRVTLSGPDPEQAIRWLGAASDKCRSAGVWLPAAELEALLGRLVLTFRGDHAACLAAFHRALELLRRGAAPAHWRAAAQLLLATGESRTEADEGWAAAEETLWAASETADDSSEGRLLAAASRLNRWTIAWSSRGAVASAELGDALAALEALLPADPVTEARFEPWRALAGLVPGGTAEARRLWQQSIFDCIEARIDRLGYQLGEMAMYLSLLGTGHPLTARRTAPVSVDFGLGVDVPPGFGVHVLYPLDALADVFDRELVAQAISLLETAPTPQSRHLQALRALEQRLGG